MKKKLKYGLVCLIAVFGMAFAPSPGHTYSLKTNVKALFFADDFDSTKVEEYLKQYVEFKVVDDTIGQEYDVNYDDMNFTITENVGNALIDAYNLSSPYINDTYIFSFQVLRIDEDELKENGRYTSDDRSQRMYFNDYTSNYKITASEVEEFAASSVGYALDAHGSIIPRNPAPRKSYDAYIVTPESDSEVSSSYLGDYNAFMTKKPGTYNLYAYTKTDEGLYYTYPFTVTITEETSPAPQPDASVSTPAQPGSVTNPTVSVDNTNYQNQAAPLVENHNEVVVTSSTSYIISALLLIGSIYMLIKLNKNVIIK